MEKEREVDRALCPAGILHSLKTGTVNILTDLLSVFILHLIVFPLTSVLSVSAHIGDGHSVDLTFTVFPSPLSGDLYSFTPGQHFITLTYEFTLCSLSPFP